MTLRTTIIAALHPRGSTGRRRYRWAIADGAALAIAAAVPYRLDLLSWWTVLPLFVGLTVVAILLTVRRLRDAALSPYLIFFVLVPDIMKLDAGTLGATLGVSSLELAHLFHAIPVLIGLVAPGREVGHSVEP